MVSEFTEGSMRKLVLVSKKVPVCEFKERSFRRKVLVSRKASVKLLWLMSTEKS
jgi:hypothetical protein